jgi:hypothetical protein
VLKVSGATAVLRRKVPAPAHKPERSGVLKSTRSSTLRWVGSTRRCGASNSKRPESATPRPPAAPPDPARAATPKAVAADAIVLATCAPKAGVLVRAVRAVRRVQRWRWLGVACDTLG